MVAYSHLTISAFTTSIALSFFYHDIKWLHLTIAMFTSLLPDLDNSRSTLGRLLPFLSKKIQKRFGHRGVVHSVYFCLLLFSPLFVVVYLNPNISFSFWAVAIWGYISHLFADSMTITGVKILYPSKSVFVFPYSADYRVRTGSYVDYLIGSFFLIATIIYLGKTADIGYTGKVREVVGLPLIAMDQVSSYDRKEYLVNGVVFNKYTRERLSIKNARLLHADENTLYIQKRKVYRLTSDNYEFKTVKIKPLDKKFNCKKKFAGRRGLVALAGFLYTDEGDEIEVDYLTYKEFVSLTKDYLIKKNKQTKIRESKQTIKKAKQGILSSKVSLDKKFKLQKKIDELELKIKQLEKQKEIVKLDLVYIYDVKS